MTSAGNTMTQHDNVAIGLLGEALDRIHDDLKDQIEGTERRMLAKLNEVCARVRSIETECSSRKAACAVEMEQLQKHAQPSVYRQATKGAFDGFFRFTVKAAVIAGMISSVIVLLDKLGLI